MDDFDTWLRRGIANKWISDPGCYFHSVIPLNDEERRQVDETGETDRCVTIVRVYGEQAC